MYKKPGKKLEAIKTLDKIRLTDTTNSHKTKNSAKSEQPYFYLIQTIDSTWGRIRMGDHPNAIDLTKENPTLKKR